MSKKAYKRNQGGYAEGPLSGCLYGLTYSPLGSLIGKYRVNNSITLSTSVEMIFDYCNDYTYSPAGRLLTKNVTSTRLSSSVAGTLYNVDYSNNYTYPTSGNVFGVKNVYDGVSGTQTDMNWDANGNLISTSHDNRDKCLMCWTEDNRLQAYSRISDDEGNMAAWYNYNAGGDRNFKLTTPQTRMRQNADVFRSGAALAYPTLYASSLVTVNKNGYTKHYFEGSRRVCSKIGGGFASVDQQYTDSQMPEIDESYFEQYVAQNENLMTTFSECLDVNPQLDVYHDLYDVIMHEHGRDDSEPAFYYHSDHLGSAAYLTNDAGQVTQTLNYLPYGEDWVDIQNFAETQYPRLGIYSFNGKEKDYESGYHYYGARYYWSEVLTGWLSVDPMMDKYPSMSPYNYCAWNPVNVVDPNGMDTIFSFALKTNDAERNAKNKKILQWMRDLGDNPNLFIISMHGTPKYMEYVNNNDGHKEDQFVRLTPKMLAQKIKSDYNIYSSNLKKNKQTVFILYSCETGKGSDNFGQQLSSELPLSIVFAPVGSIWVSNNQTIDNAEAIKMKNGDLKKGAHRNWGIYVDGKLVMTFSYSAPQSWMKKQGGISGVIKLVNQQNKKEKK